jgi:uncharacterized membrane protein
VGPGRLKALIDGLFAIALTLLVLDLPRPLHAESLARDLLHEWPSYVAYLVSFATVGVIWIEHHAMLSAVRRIDRRFLELSLVFLLLVSVVPWPTALAAEYARSGDQARTAAVLYAATMLCMGLAFAASWAYLGRHPSLVEPAAAPAFPAGTRRALLGSVAYLVALAVAFASPLASFGVDAAIAVYFAVSRSGVPGLLVGSDAVAD